MNNKLNILYYSDCSFFAGCENMMAIFLNNKILNEKFNINFLYVESIAYSRELRNRVDVTEKKVFSVDLPRPNSVHEFFKRKITNKYLRIVTSAPIIFFWKYYCILFSIYPLYKKVKKMDIDILHINNGGYPAAVSCYSMVIVAYLLKIKKVIYMVNNIAESYKNPFRWLDWFLDRLVKKKVTYFVTGSKFANRALGKTLALDEDRIYSIPNGIAPRTITLDALTFKREFDIPSNKVIFSVIALLELRKGHLFLLKSIVKLKDNPIFKDCDFPLFIFEGSGSEYDNIKSFIMDNGLVNDVMMIGSIKDIFNLINATDVLILPSISNEDWPNIVMEAMLNQKPVIGTRIAGIPEQIEHAKTGYVVEPLNVEDMEKAIINLLNAYLREEFSLNAKARFDKEFTVDASVSKYLTLYNK